MNNYIEKNNIIVNFIKRNTKKRYNPKEDVLLKYYLKLIGDFKDTNLTNFLDTLCTDIFESNEVIEKKIFLSNVKAVHNKLKKNVIFTLFGLMKIEFDLI